MSSYVGNILHKILAPICKPPDVAMWQHVRGETFVRIELLSAAAVVAVAQCVCVVDVKTEHKSH